MTQRVLVIGLDPRRVPGDWDPEPVLAKIETGLAEFEDHGVAVEACLVALDGSEDVPTVVAGALQGGVWDCVVVGGGLRHDPDLAELFEQVVNLVRRHAPHTPIAFNATPGDTFAAASRHLATTTGGNST
jgi:hypothetical protein